MSNNKKLNYVVFTKTAKPVSDFEIEQRFQELKDMHYVEISSQLLLYRFRVGVLRKEIEPFELVVVDFDGTNYSEVITESGKFNEGTIYNAKIMGLYDKYLDELIGF